MNKFELSENFLDNYKRKKPRFGFGELGRVTYLRTYSRVKADGTHEDWWETVKRVVEGTYQIQRNHCDQYKLPWNGNEAQRSAQKMYDLIYNFKFTPPGRGLWFMGTDYMFDKGSAGLNNCAFVSTENIDVDFAEPFVFLMDMSMLGVGVGGDTKGAGKMMIKEPKIDGPYVVEDSREGWVDLIRTLLNSYFKAEYKQPSEVDYSQVRKEGAKIHGFGGIASGPQPLIDCYNDIKKIMDAQVGKPITSEIIVDIFNLVGKCVVSGGVRRTAEIMYGSPEDESYLELKNPEINQEALYSHRWASNNSVFAEVGMDYTKTAEMTAKNGEPGYQWMQNARHYSRMGETPDFKDYRAAGANPCNEQTLESFELCCLVETYPSNHDSLQEWEETLKYAYLYAKTVTLLPTHNPKTNAVMMRNRRIGCSISGITQAFTKFGRRATFEAMKKGYDAIQDWDNVYSDWLAIPRSIKTTSIKPSGTVSLLAGVTPGIHYPYAEYYIRNVRMQQSSPLVQQLKDAGYTVEKDKYASHTVVVSFPVHVPNVDRTVDEVTLWEQMENVSQVQKYWADNQVSVTITFTTDEAKDIKNCLELYEDQLKGVSFLPVSEHGYEQAPYIKITKEEYDEHVSKLGNVKKVNEKVHDTDEKYCDSDKCVL